MLIKKYITIKNSNPDLLFDHQLLYFLRYINMLYTLKQIVKNFFIYCDYMDGSCKKRSKLYEIINNLFIL